MHQPGLVIPLDPAAALPDPVADLAVGFLFCYRDHHPDAPAAPGNPYTEIRILGDVERIPGSQFAERFGPEVVRCTAERDRQAEPVQPAEHQAEVQCILCSEAAGEP